MFDDISISDQLPYTQEMKDLGLDNNVHTWQTKDLINCLVKYYIQGGRLFLQKYKHEEWVEGNKNSDSFADSIGHLNRSDPYLEPVAHHGEVYFYNYINDVHDKWDCWVEFKAIFTDGIVSRYELVKFEKTDNTERKKLHEDWKLKLQYDNSRWYNKYFFYTKAYRRFSRLWYKLFTKIGDFFYYLSYKV